MRKKLFFLLLVCAAAISVKAQHAWKELNEFHDVMSATYHPSEEGKLQPIRSRSQEMLDKAIAWKNSTAPEGFDMKAVKKNLKELVRGASALHKMVKENAADADLKKSLAGLHELFHGIVEKCEKEEHGK